MVGAYLHSTVAMNIFKEVHTCTTVKELPLLEVTYLRKPKDERLVEFLKQNACHECLYHDLSTICYIVGFCCLELSSRDKRNNTHCSFDRIGNCPYANETGSCFGFCLQNILIDYRERKNKRVQGKEKEDG